MLILNTVKQFESNVGTKKVICIGAGKMAKSFVAKYISGLKGRIVVLDNSPEKIGKIFAIGDDECCIEAVSVLEKYNYSEYSIVIACNKYQEIIRQLKDMKCMQYDIFIYPFIEERDKMFVQQIRRCYSDYYYYNHMDLAYREEFIEERMSEIGSDELVIPYLPVYLTSRCTLNCESCNNLMPYFKEKKADYCWDKTRKSLENILEVVKEMIFCELVGGEPFLYKDLGETLDFVGNQKKIRQIVIVTNGTIIPDATIIEKLKKYNVLVRISDYGLFDKISRLVSVLEKEHINIRILQDMKWNNPGGIEKRNKSYEELHFQYNRCVFSLRCKYLFEDKLFTCARMASLFLLNKTNADKDLLDLSEKDDMKNKLKAFYLREDGEACDYCDLCSLDKGEEIPAAKQVGRDYYRSEYTIIRTDDLERLKRR